MKTTELGDTGIEITRIGFGAWAIGGGDWEFGWGPQDDDRVDRRDHAGARARRSTGSTRRAAYGLGHSEEIVGRAVDGRAAARPYVFTKCAGVGRGAGRRSAQPQARLDPPRGRGSLARLGVDVIDLYQIHWPDPGARTSRRGGRRSPS